MNLSRRGRRASLIAVVAAIVLALAAWGIASALPRPLHTVTLRASSAAFPNPERGWTDAVDLIDGSGMATAEHDGVTIVHSYLRLDADRNQAIPSSTLAALGRGFAALRAAHLKVVLRVAYNFSGTGQDAPLARIEQHAQQLKPVLAANQDVVFSFEAGFIGAWGEWHDSTNGLDTTAAKAAVLRAVLAAFPSSRDVALRYPADIRTLLPEQVTASTAYNGSAAARVGNHEDCFLSSVPDDGGTWGQHGDSVTADKRMIASLGRYTVVGGETCGVSPRVTCPTALDQLALLHFSYLNQQFDPAALRLLQQGGCSQEIGQRLGYRLAVTRLGWTQQVGAGGALGLRLEVRNSGFAHVVNARPVDLVLTRGSRTVTIPLRTDIRTWAAGTTTTVQQDVRLPASVTKGRWSMALWMPDAASTLQRDPAYSIRLANTGVWDPTTGRNRLPATVLVQ
ncbi:MAG: DUF4832 domain-containing protein [Acidobacteria bacterium]|nr:DUF4832 domain-containing protein [Acidobacteriota bacterium]